MVFNPFATKASYPSKEDPSIRRSYLSPQQLIDTPSNGHLSTVADVLPFVAQKYGDKVGVYTRSVKRVVEEKKKVPKKGGEDGEMEEKVWKL